MAHVTFTGRTFTIRIRPILEAGEPCHYVATAAGISMSARTLEKAVSLLKERMIAQYERLSKLPMAQLGKIPRRQLALLQTILEATE